MKKKKKWKAPQSTLRERLEQRAERRRDSQFFTEPDPECRQIRWENLPVTMLQPFREHLFQKTVAAILVVICLGIFSFLNMPLTNRLTDAVHYLTVHHVQPAELVEAARPVMQSVRELNWRRSPVVPDSGQPQTAPEETMAAPVNGILRSPYGPRMAADTGQMEMHYGIDVTAEAGSSVYAAFSGNVTMIKEHPEYGLTIYLEHPNNMVTIYGRVANPAVAAGERISRGQEIAVVAARDAGESHIHFEVWKDREPVDPEGYLSAMEVLETE